MIFGAHVSASGGIDKAAERAAALGSHAVQMFTQSPRMWRPGRHEDDAIARFRELRQQHDIQTAVTHAIYLINLASADDELCTKSVNVLLGTVDAAERIGLDAVIFHPGSHREAGFDAVAKRVAQGISSALEHSTSTWVLIENCAGQGGTIARSIDEIARLIDLCDDHPRLGVCIDTCHWWASGVDITEPAILDSALDELDARIGIERLRCLHINDSQTPCGSNRDRHANIGDGEIGAGLATFLQSPRLQHLPAILEVPGDGDGPTIEELAKVRALHDG